MFVFKFETCIFDEKQGVLTRDGQPIPIEPQVAQVLGILLREADNTVSRDDLLKEVWNNRSVSPGVVDNRIRAVRNAIGDDGRTQRLIKTYSNVGYKFVGSLERVDQTQAEDSREDRNKPSLPTRSKPTSPWKWIALATFAAMVVLSVVTIQLVGQLTGPDMRAEVPETEVQPTEIPRNSVAVLPFLNDNGEGLSEALPPLESLLVSKLASAPNLLVTSPRSSNRFSSVSMSAPVIGMALKTRHLITGEIRANSDGAELMVRLLDAQEDKLLWASTIDLGSDVDEFDMTAEAAVQRTALQVLNKLGVPPDPLESDLISREAAEKFTKSVEILQLNRDETIQTAIEFLEEVVSAEPDFLPAYEEIAMAYHLGVQYAGLEVTDATALITQYTGLAGRVTSSGRGLFMMRGLQAMYQGDLDLALSHLDQAIRLDPKHRYSVSLRAEVLALLGDLNASEQAFKDALAFDPLSPDLLSQLARTSFGQQKHADALARAQTNNLWNPGHPDAVTDLALFRKELGHYKDAYPMFQQAIENRSNSRAQFEMLSLLYSLGQLDPLDSFSLTPEINVLAYTLAGNEVLARLEQSRDPMGIFSGYMEYTFGDKRPLYDFLSSTGRYAQYLQPSAQISSLYIYDAIFYADASAEFAPDKTSKILENVEAYFSRQVLSEFQTEEELKALAGLRSLQGDIPGLLTALQLAEDRNLVFVGALRGSPVFERARENADFLAALEQMEERADDIWTSIQAAPTASQ